MRKHIDEIRAESDRDYKAYIDLLDHCEETHQILLDALKAIIQSAVILSDDYLECFAFHPMDATIQRWDKARWIQASADLKTANNAIEAASYVEVSE